MGLIRLSPFRLRHSPVSHRSALRSGAGHELATDRDCAEGRHLVFGPSAKGRDTDGRSISADCLQSGPRASAYRS
jgi:hypothetical protein